MSESLPNETEEAEKERKKKEYIALAEKLAERREGLPFPGINPESYAALKAAEEEFPGFATPIDELVRRFESEGFKVAFGKELGNVYVLPLGSDDIEKDSVLPQHLNVSEDMDEAVRDLVLANKN
jgi:hypothetical protein